LRLGTGLPTAEEAGEEAASAGRTTGELVLQVRDPGLSRIQRLLLHHNGLGHVVRRIRLPRGLRADEFRSLCIWGRRLTLDLSKLAKQRLDGLTILMIHLVQFSLVMKRITLPADP
jgi:hypothetical protein